MSELRMETAFFSAIKTQDSIPTSVRSAATVSLAETIREDLKNWRQKSTDAPFINTFLWAKCILRRNANRKRLLKPTQTIRNRLTQWRSPNHTNLIATVVHSHGQSSFSTPTQMPSRKRAMQIAHKGQMAKSIQALESQGIFTDKTTATNIQLKHPTERPRNESHHDLAPKKPPPLTQFKPFSPREVDTAIRKMNGNAAPGGMELSTRHLK